MIPSIQEFVDEKSLPAGESLDQLVHWLTDIGGKVARKILAVNRRDNGFVGDI